MNKRFLDQVEPFITLLSEKPRDEHRKCEIHEELKNYIKNTILDALISEKNVELLERLLKALEEYNTKNGYVSNYNDHLIKIIKNNGDNIEIFEIVYKYHIDRNNKAQVFEFLNKIIDFGNNRKLIEEFLYNIVSLYDYLMFLLKDDTEFNLNAFKVKYNKYIINKTKSDIKDLIYKANCYNNKRIQDFLKLKDS